MTMAMKAGAALVSLDTTHKYDEQRDDTIDHTYAIKQLPRLFSADQVQCQARFIPLIEATLKQDVRLDLHSVAANSYLEIISAKKEVISLFLPSILIYLDSSDSNISGTWLKVLLESIPHLPEDEIGKLCSLALEKCHVNEDYQRCSAIRILGQICATFGTPESSIVGIVNSKIWPVFQSLSQDVEPNVRSAVCRQLHHVAPILKLSVLKCSLIPCLIELTLDEYAIVNTEALEACVKLAAIVPVSVLKTSLLPLIISVGDRVKKFTTPQPLSVSLAANIAPLWSTLHSRGVIDPDSKAWLTNTLKNLITDAKNCPDAAWDSCAVDVRRFCAESLPVLFSKGRPNVGKLFLELAVDPNADVRKATAFSIIKCADNSFLSSSLVKPIRELLMDKNEAVLYTIVSNLNATVGLLCKNGAFATDIDGRRSLLSEGILACARFLNDSRNWRLVEQLYLQMACVVQFLSSNFIYNNFYKRITDKILNARVLPVRHAACRTWLIILRFNLISTQRQKIREWMRVELLLAHSCFDRLLFVNLCGMAADIFSKDYFNTHFLQLVVTLKDDPVVNVRLALATLLPKLLAMAEGNNESCDIVRMTWDAMLAVERDRDVKEALNASPKYQLMSAEEDRKRKDEENKLLNLRGNCIALIKQPIGPRMSLKSQPTQQKITRPSGSNSGRTNRTNHVCTCERNGLAMEMSWLNLEMELRQELRSFRVLTKRGSIFSCSFDEDFYRDAGVMPEQLTQPKPQMLARSGRSKSFVMPARAKLTATRIPVSHRRSMDVNNWTAKTQNDTASTSRLPVRYIPKTSSKNGGKNF